MFVKNLFLIYIYILLVNTHIYILIYFLLVHILGKIIHIGTICLHFTVATLEIFIFDII